MIPIIKWYTKLSQSKQIKTILILIRLSVTKKIVDIGATIAVND